MQILDGKKLQKNFLNEIKKTVYLLQIKPTLLVISIEDNPINKIYLKQIEKMCLEVGFHFSHIHFEAITEASLLKFIKDKNEDPEITGILLLSPLPFYLDEKKIRNCIVPRKDIEGIGEENQLTRLKEQSGYNPCTVMSIIQMLEFHNIDIEEKNIVILNRSDRIGKPLFNYFLNKNCTVTMMHSKTKEKEYYLKKADIVITAMGIGPILKSHFFKTGSTVIDVGMHDQNNQITGDVLIEEDNPIEYYISHTGGIGPMTIASLAQNILTSYYLEKGR